MNAQNIRGLSFDWPPIQTAHFFLVEHFWLCQPVLCIFNVMESDCTAKMCFIFVDCHFTVVMVDQGCTAFVYLLSLQCVCVMVGQFVLGDDDDDDCSFSSLLEFRVSVDLILF